MRLIHAVLAVLLIAGCADTHTLTRSGGSQAAVSLQRQSSAYVAVPPDGRYEATLYMGSGAMTAQAVATAFGPYLSKVVMGNKVESEEQALASAKAGGFGYLLVPQILHWEDRATEWSALPDVATVKLSVLSASTGALLDSVVIDGKSGLATLGGDHPQDLLPKPMSEYAASLFR